MSLSLFHTHTLQWYMWKWGRRFQEHTSLSDTYIHSIVGTTDKDVLFFPHCPELLGSMSCGDGIPHPKLSQVSLCEYSLQGDWPQTIASPEDTSHGSLLHWPPTATGEEIKTSLTSSIPTDLFSEVYLTCVCYDYNNIQVQVKSREQCKFPVPSGSRWF